MKRPLRFAIPRLLATSLIAFACVSLFAGQAMAQRGDKECQSLMKQIDDLVDHVEKLSAANQDLSDKLEHAHSEEVKKHGAQSLETGKSTLRKTKVKIDKLLDELCACCATKHDAGVQLRGKNCEALMKQIDDLVDHVEKLSAANQDLSDKLEHAHSEEVKKHGAQSLETGKSTLRKTKVKIDKLLDELCACCGKKPANAGKPKPTPGQATSDTLKKVFESVHIGVGGGYSSGHDEHHHERRGGSSSSHKTVTSGCKCHPCTCSPCTCH